MADKFLSKREVLDTTGLSHVTQWRMEKRGEFPKRRQISPNRVAWLESEIIAWMESRPVSQIDPVMNSSVESKFLIGNLVDAGDSLAAAISNLAKSPTVDGCDILLSRLQGGQQGVRQLRTALLADSEFSRDPD